MKNVFKILAVSAIVLGAVNVNAEQIVVSMEDKTALAGAFYRLEVFDRFPDLAGGSADDRNRIRSAQEEALQEYVFKAVDGNPVTHNEAYVQYLEWKATEFMEQYNFNQPVPPAEEIYGQLIAGIARIKAEDRLAEILPKVAAEAMRRWRLVGLPE